MRSASSSSEIFSSSLLLGMSMEMMSPSRTMPMGPPEAASGGPIGIVKEGDIISIDIPNNKLELKISDEELAQRMASFVPNKKELSGYLKRYAALVSSGAKGAILNV